MAKPKKLTYNELGGYIYGTEQRLMQAINTIGQTITDYIEFKGDKEDFMEILKEKYSKKEDSDDMPDVQKEDKKETKPKIHRI